MFKLPDHIHSNVPHSSLSSKYTSEFEPEDINVWTKYINIEVFSLSLIKTPVGFRFFDQTQILGDEDRNRVNHIFNKLVTNIVKYENKIFNYLRHFLSDYYHLREKTKTH
jgi:hypothetical protein